MDVKLKPCLSCQSKRVSLLANQTELGIVCDECGLIMSINKPSFTTTELVKIWNYRRSERALKIVRQYNRLANDLDDYLHAIAQWGLGKRSRKPTLDNCGLAYILEDRTPLYE